MKFRISEGDKLVSGGISEDRKKIFHEIQDFPKGKGDKLVSGGISESRKKIFRNLGNLGFSGIFEYFWEYSHSQVFKDDSPVIWFL